MDPVTVFSLAATAVQLVDLCVKSARGLHDIYSAQGQAVRTLLSIERECLTLRAAVQGIEDWSKSRYAKAPERGAQVRALDDALTALIPSVKVLNEDVEKMLLAVDGKGKMKATGKLMFTWGRDEMAVVLEEIRWGSHMVHMLITVINLPADKAQSELEVVQDDVSMHYSLNEGGTSSFDWALMNSAPYRRALLSLPRPTLREELPDGLPDISETAPMESSSPVQSGYDRDFMNFSTRASAHGNETASLRLTSDGPGMLKASKVDSATSEGTDEVFESAEESYAPPQARQSAKPKAPIHVRRSSHEQESQEHDPASPNSSLSADDIGVTTTSVLSKFSPASKSCTIVDTWSPPRSLTTASVKGTFKRMRSLYEEDRFGEMEVLATKLIGKLRVGTPELPTEQAELALLRAYTDLTRANRALWQGDQIIVVVEEMLTFKPIKDDGNFWKECCIDDIFGLATDYYSAPYYRDAANLMQACQTILGHDPVEHRDFLSACEAFICCCFLRLGDTVKSSKILELGRSNDKLLLKSLDEINKWHSRVEDGLGGYGDATSVAFLDNAAACFCQYMLSQPWANILFLIEIAYAYLMGGQIDNMLVFLNSIEVKVWRWEVRFLAAWYSIRTMRFQDAEADCVFLLKYLFIPRPVKGFASKRASRIWSGWSTGPTARKYPEIQYQQAITLMKSICDSEKRLRFFAESFLPLSELTLLGLEPSKYRYHPHLPVDIQHTFSGQI